MSRFSTPQLSALTPYVPGEQPPRSVSLIKLNTNENPYPPGPAVRAVLTDAAVDSLRLYPDPDCRELKEAVAEAYGLQAENVYVGNGSDEVLAFIFKGLCPKGAAFPDISYGFYPVFADMFQIPYREVPLRDDLSLDIADYKDTDSTLFIANPNAPTGLTLSIGEIRNLLEQNRERLVVVDEAYVDFGCESAVKLIDSYDNLLIVQTLSKSRQLAGGRIGLALGQKELISDLETLKFSFNPYSVNSLALMAATASFKDMNWFEEHRDRLIENRRFLSRNLTALGFHLTDSRANFVFAAPPAGLSGEEFFQQLRKRNIIVRWFDKPRIKNYVRITIGRRDQLETLLQATMDILQERKLL
ncbi:MAG: histidinol-phosphate transaminase [Firmicutes bacterium]|nr:histidinol-phosphate transaminase [Bacillota bacterium]